MKSTMNITSRIAFRWLFALMTAALPGAAIAIDPDLPFSSGSTGADGPLTFRAIPSGRTSLGMAYDAARQEVVLFGGWINNVGQADTWVWRGGNWIRLFPPVSPPDRWSHKMVYDAARQEIVMFGGTRPITGRLNDTWTWNGTTWTQKTPASSPSPRDEFCMAYDAARQQVVIFGGNGGSDETWLWDGSNWTQANPAKKPPGTASSAMAYDSARQECVLFGNHGQTWTWNGQTWTLETPLNEPAGRNFPTLINDGSSNTILLFSGSNRQDTWTWNGSEWRQLSPANSPGGRQYHAVVYDAARQRGVMFGGDIPGVDSLGAETWLWNGTNWELWSNKTQFFDMKARASGIWNFTTIEIPSGVTVKFTKNSGNTPVRWLATGDVTINGAIDVGGEFGGVALLPGIPARGGPGGFDGGRGGILFRSSASFAGQPGQGPGGGAPGTAPQTNPQNLRDGKDGAFNGNYGNAFLQPLDGGSGGGGGTSNDDWNGGNGGGGGGAILISSSRDIAVSGVVRANGGHIEFSNASLGGRGSGGAILLRADRVSGPGSLEAYGGQNNNPNNPNGRIRVEAYVRSLTGGQIPEEVVGLPAANGELNQVGTLRIVSVKGVNVVSPPTGNQNTPDVVFSDAGPVQIVVQGSGVPNGTAVNLRITTASSVIEPTPQNLVNGTATFNTTVPKGIGTLQATAKFAQP